MKTKLNEKNAANVMGKVNTFFKKNVKEDLGIKKVEVGTRDILDDNGRLLCKFPIFENQQVFVSYSGRCDVHWLRKELLEKIKNGSRISRFDNTDCLLAISTPYDSDCVPISIGDTVEFKGNQLIVKHSYYKGSCSTRRFVQMDITPEELLNEKKNGLYSQLTWFCDDSMWWDMAMEEFDGMAIEINCIRNEIYNAFSYFIDNLDLSKLDETFRRTINMKDISEDHYVRNDDFSFDIIVDMKAFNNPGSSEVFDIILNDKSTDIYGVICKAFTSME